MSNPSNLNSKDFSITIDFDKDSPNPSRVFKAMTSLIESFEGMDRALVKHIDNKIETVMLLEDIEKGSLKTWLSNILNGIPDEAISELDWKKVVGHYLLKAKYILLDKINGKVRISDGKDIEGIEDEINKAAKEIGVDKFPSYVPFTKKAIIDNLGKISDSLQYLSDTDKAYYESEYGKASFNLDLSVDFENLEDLLVKEKLESTTPMILKVKKPDFLGDSMWDFKYGSRTVSAKISDLNWLDGFRSNLFIIKPQDSLKCDVKVIAKYDDNLELISETWEIVKIVEVVERNYPKQLSIGE